MTGAAIGVCLVLTAAVCLGAAQIWDDGLPGPRGCPDRGGPDRAVHDRRAGRARGLAWGSGSTDRSCAWGPAALCGAVSFGILSSDRAALMNTSDGALIFSIVIVALPVSRSAARSALHQGAGSVAAGRSHGAGVTSTGGLIVW